ncbi:uncharacterized protein TNCV_3784811 [Trichonephila clavipes]|nr:uncharacterized protein TNCV_3784811 [Trichonephila clavipes]
MTERISCTSSRSMLTLPEKALLVKLYYQNGECASAALRSYRHTKGIRRGKGPLTNAAVARMISKFEVTGCLDDRSRSGQPSTRRNTAETVKTDEAHFTLRGSVNTHNCRIWASENPRTVVETPLHDEKVTVWVGFTTSTVIEPFFFEEMHDSGFVTATVTGERYADMLQNHIIPSLADKHLLERTIFMQDGAPPHIARRVKDLLRRSFGDDRVLSRHFHHAWLPRSPDFSPCDYWLWGYLKSQVYRDRLTSLGMLKDNIRLQCLTITPDLLYSAVHNIIPRLQLLLRNDGEHLEHFL